DSYPTNSWHGQLELFQTLADQLWKEEGQARDIAARPRQARHEPARHRFAGRYEDNRERLGRMLGGQRREGASVGHDDVDLERSQLGGERGKPFVFPIRIAIFDHDCTALDVSEVTQSLPEGLVRGGIGSHAHRQVTDSSDPVRRLGQGRERSGEEKDSGREEGSPLHYSIT